MKFMANIEQPSLGENKDTSLPSCTEADLGTPTTEEVPSVDDTLRKALCLAVAKGGFLGRVAGLRLVPPGTDSIIRDES